MSNDKDRQLGRAALVPGFIPCYPSDRPQIVLAVMVNHNIDDESIVKEPHVTSFMCLGRSGTFWRRLYDKEHPVKASQKRTKKVEQW